MVQLVISYDGKNVNVNGPINDKMLSYSLLEMARDLIKDYKPGEIQIVPASSKVS